MSAVVDDSKLFKPFLPRLFHLALVQVTLPIFTSFGYDLITKAYKRIEYEESPNFCVNSRPEICDEDYKRAKECLKEIPYKLRRDVYETSEHLLAEIETWDDDHPGLTRKECIFQWKGCGTIDRIKTAEEFVMKRNNDVHKRFEMACIYCMEESILAIWAEMKNSGDAEHFYGADESSDGDEENSDVADEYPDSDGDNPDVADESSDSDEESSDVVDDSIVDFWVRRMRDGSRVPWTRALLEFDDGGAFGCIKSYSSFFPLLQPEERQEVLPNLFTYATLKDFHQCLYSLSKDEEELLLQTKAKRVFFLYSLWPLRSQFLEIVEKIIKYLNGNTFKSIVRLMLDFTRDNAYGDEVELFQGLWDRSPDKLKDVVRACPCLFPDIQPYLFNETKKREAEDDELTNIERKIMKNE